MATNKRKFQTSIDNENRSKSKKTRSKYLSRWPVDSSNFKSSTKPIEFSHLPDEILLTILTYLNKSSIVAFGQTCRRFRSIASHPTLWRRVDLSYKRIDSAQLVSLLRRGTMTLKMYQTTINTISMPIDTFNCHLKHLDLTTTILSSDLLECLLRSCRSLRKLSLESLPLNYSIVKEIAANEHLDTLNLAMCTGLTFECGQMLIDQLTSLKSLNIAWTNLSIETVQIICDNLPRSLEQLNISGQRYNFTDEHLQLLVRRAIRLRVLDISDSLLLTDQSLVAIRQYSRLLTHLSASRCYLFTSSALIQLKLLAAFSHLDLFGTLGAFPMQQLRDEFGTRIRLNSSPISTIARPTIGNQRTSIWGLRTRN